MLRFVMASNVRESSFSLSHTDQDGQEGLSEAAPRRGMSRTGDGGRMVGSQFYLSVCWMAEAALNASVPAPTCSHLAEQEWLFEVTW